MKGGREREGSVRWTDIKREGERNCYFNTHMYSLM